MKKENKGMKSKKKSWLVLIVVVLMIAACGYVSAYGYGKDHIGTAKNIKLGLDLAGGVNITYEADEDNPSSEDMNDTVYKLQQRVEAWSTEAEVYQEGTNRVNVDIPGVYDAATPGIQYTTIINNITITRPMAPAIKLVLTASSPNLALTTLELISFSWSFRTPARIVVAREFTSS